MNELYIYGAGSIARETIKLIKKINLKKKTWKIKGLVCKNFVESDLIDGIKLIDQNTIKKTSNTYAICAISDPIKKRKVARDIKKKKIKLAKLICPEIFIYNEVKIGNGTIIFSNSQIGHTTKIGENTLISFGVDIGHNISMGDGCTILPNSSIGGYVDVGDLVLMGSGVNIMPKIKIGSNSRIGIGSTVIKDVNKNCTMIVEQKKIILPRKPIKDLD
jgi:sugar O-acyltransferase (sialic acid O-acetyltransferase NeuD family)